MTLQSDAFRVLVVEDDEATRYAWTRVLTNAGFEVTAVETVEAALAALPDGCDVLLTDQKLPDGNGAELIERAMQAGLLGATATLICTAYTPSQLQKGMHLGVLRKPVEHDELIAMVERGAREARQLQHLNAIRGAATRARIAPEPTAEQARQAGVLAGVLTEQKERIIALWRTRVEALQSPVVRELELLDHTPQLVAELARAMRSPERQQAIAANAALHGAQRYRIGFDLHSVVREYSILRESILEVAAEQKLEPSISEHELLTRYFLEAIAVAVKRFVDEHPQSLRRS